MQQFQRANAEKAVGDPSHAVLERLRHNAIGLPLGSNAPGVQCCPDLETEGLALRHLCCF